MELYPVYENPYDAVSIDENTVLKLHRFGVGNPDLMPFISNLSPFATKLEAYFRIFKVPHEIVLERSTEGAPRDKVPYISVGDTKLTDSDLVIGYLKRTYFDPDASLTPAQWALGHLVQRTLEDHLYWIIIYYEFYDRNGWDFFLKAAVGDPSALPPFILTAFEERDADFVKRCYDQGIARYTPAEIIDKACKDLRAVSQILSDNRYLLGTDKPTSFDAVLLGFVIAIYQAKGMHPEITDFARTIPNLGRYVQHMLATYFPELKLAFQPA